MTRQELKDVLREHDAEKRKGGCCGCLVMIAAIWFLLAMMGYCASGT